MAFGNLLGYLSCLQDTKIHSNLEHAKYPYTGLLLVNLTQPRVTQEKEASVEKLSRFNLPMAMPVRDYLD